MSASPAATCWSTPARRPRRCCRSSSGGASFRFAGPHGVYAEVADIAGTRIATSYVGVVRAFLEERGIDATVVRLDGAVETSIQLGVADVIADVVETGQHAAPGRPGDLRRDHPRLGGGADHPVAGQVPPDFEIFRRRVEGVLVARSYVMMDYDIPEAAVAAAWRSPRASRAPRCCPLHKEGWVAVRAMVRRDGVQRLMDELYEIGARAILLTDIHACRL